MPLQLSRRELLGVAAGGITTLAGCARFGNETDTATLSEPEFGTTDSVWPMLSQNPANTAFADIQFPETDFQSQQLCTAGNADRTDAPILAGQNLLISRTSDGDGSGGVFGIDPETGDENWQNSDHVSYTTPSVYGQTAIFSGSGTTAALDVNSGELHWEQSVGGSGFYKTHLKVEDSIIVSTGSGQNLVALDAYTGDKQWSSPELGVVFGLATLGSKVVAARSSNDESGLVAIDTSSGEIDWTNNTTSAVSQPVAASGLVLHTDVVTGVLHAFDIETGEQEWQYSTDSDASAPPAGDANAPPAGDANAPPAVDTDAGRVFLPVSNIGLHVLDLQTGERRWSAEAFGSSKQPVVTENSVLVCAAVEISQVSRSDRTTTAVTTPRKSISSPLAIGSDQIFFTARSTKGSGALMYTVTP
ncbi:outer membrane protein assembly factor BamB family protein [Halobacterium jilantaiense]|uniref:PQQ-like domain-containing protein n=1 Tax=Halobacterium jilantaiense TaxID=355548 RepID=A0A1I0MYK2_9EURY|nr:PQQ-binding-like beta-propeller repeat protein [Halobacterium jilantaiense]SEV93177.1 PQQ-like domain-containing protein [Halobacterium jilantaiense]